MDTIVRPNGERVEVVSVEISGLWRNVALTHNGQYIHVPDVEDVLMFGDANELSLAGWDVMAALKQHCPDLHQWTDPMRVICVNGDPAKLQQGKIVVLKMEKGQRVPERCSFTDGFPFGSWFAWLLPKDFRLN